MKPIHFVCVYLMFAGPLVLAQANRVPSVNGPLPVKSTPPTALAQPDPARRGQIVESYGKLPLSFELNHGQTDAKVKFLSRGSGYTLFLTGDAAVFSLSRLIPTGGAVHTPLLSADAPLRRSVDVSRRNTVLRMNLVKTKPSAKVTGEDELPGRSNYFIGNDPEQWRTDVPTYAKVKYEGIYPGVDLLYYGNQRQLEYDFVVSPGANPHRIQFDVRGVRTVSTDKDGDLVFHFADGELRCRKPVVYQETNGTRQTVDAHYVIRRGHRVGFALAKYDSRRTLIIDPAVEYSSYLGGSNNDYGFAVAVDASDNVYLTGGTQSTDFPVTPGAFQTTCPSGKQCDVDGAAFVTKLNPTGTALVYSTYLGGSGSASGGGIAVDATGDAYVTGQTQSANFPTTQGVFQPTYGGASDAFVTKLNPSGSALVYSSYLGGTDNDYGFGIVLGASGNAYVTGLTGSPDFPTTPGAFQRTCGGGCYSADAFVTQINLTGSALVYSTYLGGVKFDFGRGIALDASGDAYVTGYTDSADFPITPGAFQTSCGGGCTDYDAFVTEMNPTGSALVYSTYLGGSSNDYGSGIALDASGDAYVTGYTDSADFPITPGAFQTSCGGGCTDYDAFVTEMNPTGSALVYSTYLGGSSNDYGSGIALDASGDAYVTGYTDSADFPITPGAFQTSCGGGCTDYDAFVTEMNPTGSALVYSTYLGGSSNDYGSGIALDASGDAYVTGYTDSADFPITPGAFQTSCGGGCADYDAFVIKFVPGDQVWPLALNFASEPIGVASGPQNTVLTNSGTTALAITSVTIVGANKGDFSQHNNCPASLGVGDFCTIAVTFTPTATGARNAAVSIADAAPNSPQTAALSGTGTQSVVTLSPSSLNFGYQTVGITSQPQPVMLSTDGTLNISSIVATAPFAQANNCGTVLPAGGNCMINVTFTPTSVGLQNGTLTISDSGQGSPQIAPLSGTGAQPAATISPTSLNFGIQTLGTTSSPQVTTLTNTSQVPLMITAIQITGSDFAQSNNCPSSLAPQNSCQISVTFTPRVTGTQSAVLRVTDNAPSSPQSVALTGTGANGITLSPSSLTFPNQYVGTSGLPQAVTLTNTGDTVITITNVATSPSPSDFAPLSSCGNSISPGAQCSIGVFFDPTASGIRTGVLTITDSAINSPQTVPLTGTGQDFSLVQSSSSTATVAPGQAANYTVAVAPGGGFNQTVTLTCAGAPAQSSCAVSPSSVKLGGSASAPVSVTVTTAGTSAGLTHPSGPPRGGNRLALWLAFSGLPGLVLLASRPRKRQGRQGAALACVLLIVMMLSACGGSSMGGSSGSATPAGTYSLTVVGTFTSGSANLVHSTKLTLVVQ